MENLRNYFSQQENTKALITQIISKEKLTPQKFPKLIDLFSGDAPVASFFHGLGWQDITTVDIEPANPKPDFVTKSIQGDLFTLANQILYRPDELKKSPFLPYYQQFDFLTCFNPIASDNGVLTGALLEEEITPLINFFLKKNSYYITDLGKKRFGFLR